MTGCGFHLDLGENDAFQRDAVTLARQAEDSGRTENARDPAPGFPLSESIKASETLRSEHLLSKEIGSVFHWLG